jgi:hypothetical protein
MNRAERVIETMSSSLATVNKVSGAAFMGTGIGAMSVSFSYAQSKQEEADRFNSLSETSVTQIQTHYHWEPMRQIVFSTFEFELSSEALAELRAIILADKADRRPRVKEFMQGFGSHVFGRVTLGGWYKHTAKSTATTEEQVANVQNSVATAMNWAVSASASYAGLGGAVSASSSTNQEVKNARVDAKALRCEVDGLDVRITTGVFGGTDGLPQDLWLASVQYPPQWRVIQRDAPYPIWKLIGRTGAAKLGIKPEQAAALGFKSNGAAEPDPKCGSAMLADLFEEVWIQDIFLPSFMPSLSPAQAEVLGKKEIRHVEDLEQSLRDVLDIKEQAPVDDASLSWSDASIIPIGTALVGPSLATYRNQLWCMYVGTDNHIYNNRFDGAVWEPINHSSGSTTTAEMAGIALSSRLGIFLAGNSMIYLNPSDDLGINWEPTKLEAVYAGPAVAKFKGKIYLLYADPKNNICFVVVDQNGVFQGQSQAVPGARTGKRIALAVFDKGLYCAFRGMDPDTKLYLTSFDGTKWSDAPTLIPVGRGSQEGPALAAFTGPNGRKLYCAYRGGTPADFWLYAACSSNGTGWSAPARIWGGRAASEGSPALAAFADQTGSKLYCVYRGVGQDTRLYCTTYGGTAQ